MEGKIEKFNGASWEDLNSETLEFSEEDIYKHLTKTEADILYLLHQRISDSKKVKCIEDVVEGRLKGACEHKASYQVDFNYKDIKVTEIEE